jgi:hypothetical protein
LRAALNLFQEDLLRTLLVCALAGGLIGCSRQPTQQSCVGLNPLACLAAVQVPIAPEPHDSNDAAAAKPVSTVAWRGDEPPRPVAHHAVHRTPRPIKVAAKAGAAVPMPRRSPLTNLQTTSNALASEEARANVTDPPSTNTVGQAPTTQQQVAAASAVAERMSVAALDALSDVAILVAGPDVKSLSELSGKSIAIDERYSEQIKSVRTAMAAAGAPEVQLSKGQTTAINRLVNNEVPAAIVALVSASAADSFPELVRYKTFRIPLSPRSSPAKP